MANVTINDLGAHASLLAADVFEVDNTSSADDSEKTTFALMGGLEIETSRNANANHADFSGTVGQIHLVDMSGALLTSEVVFTTPATAAVGERTGVYIVAGSVTDGEELSVRTPASDTIDGVDYSAADWSRVWQKGELVILECIIANQAWTVLYDGRIECKCRIYAGSAVTTNSANVFKIIACDTESFDVGDIGDTGNNGIKLRRKGSVIVAGSGQPDSSVADQSAYTVRLMRDATEMARIGTSQSGTGTTLYFAVTDHYANAADGTTFTVEFRAAAANKGHSGLSILDWLSVTEVLDR